MSSAALHAYPKITHPISKGVTPRTRLFSLLDAAAEARAVWIHAPAGSGKTTFVSSYVTNQRIKSIWYRIDEDDNDAANFFHYMGLAIQNASNQTHLKLQHFTSEYHAAPGQFTRYFFRQAYPALGKKRCVIVLDNFQEILPTSPMHELLIEAIKELPTHIQFVFVCRTKPPVIYSSLILKQSLIEIMPTHLLLDKDEAQAIAKSRKTTELNDNAILTSYQSSQGWLTGFLFGLQAPHKAIDSLMAQDDKQLVFNFFSTEIVKTMSLAQQQALVLCSCLTLVPQSLIQHYFEKSLADFIHRLALDNCFLTRHGSQQVDYIFQQLFQDFLQNQLHSLVSAEQMQDFLTFAVDSLLTKQYVDEAFRVCAKQQDVARCIDIILQYAESNLSQGRVALVESWLTSIPEKWYQKLPQLRLINGLCKQSTDLHQSVAEFEAAFQGFNAIHDYQNIIRTASKAVHSIQYSLQDLRLGDRWMSRIEAAYAEVSHGLDSETEACAAAGVLLGISLNCPESARSTFWLNKGEASLLKIENAETKIGLALQMIGHHLYFGDFNKGKILLDTLERQWMSDDIPTFPQLVFLMYRTLYAWPQVEIEQGLHWIDQALALAEKTGVTMLNAFFYAFRTYFTILTNNPEATENCLTAYQAELKKRKNNLEQTRYILISAWLNWQENKLMEAAQRLEQGSDALEAQTFNFYYPKLNMYFPLACIYTELGQHDKATEVLEKARGIVNTIPSLRIRYELLITNVLISWLQQNEEEVHTFLTEALAISADTGIIMTPGLNMRLLAQVLDFALANSIEPLQAQRMIHALRLPPPEHGRALEQWPYPIKIRTLGRFSLLIDDKSVSAGRKAPKKMLELLKAIIAFGGKEVSGEKLAQSVWPDQDGDSGYNTFTTTLHRLRKLIGHDSILYSDGRVTLHPKVYWVDIWHVERQMNQLLNMTDELLGRRGQNLLQIILKQYQGPFLGSDEGLSWSLSMRERLQQKLIAAIHKITQQMETTQRYDDALALYQRALELDDVHEGFYQGAMRCCVQLGKSANGIVVYQRCRSTLHKRLHVSPSKDTEQLRQQLQKEEYEV